MELGGEFYLDLNTLSEKKHSVDACLSGEHPLYFDSGRSALRFYRLTPSLEIDMDDLLSKLNGEISAVFLMHYFGAVQPRPVLEQLEAARLRYGFSIVEDTTHSVFSTRRTIGDLCVCSLRKWFALPGGGALYGQLVLERKNSLPQPKTDNSRAYGMVCKALFLSQKLDCNAEYLDIFRETEDALDAQTENFQISDFSCFLLNTVDIDALIAQRQRNGAYLSAALSSIGISPFVKRLHRSVRWFCPFGRNSAMHSEAA